MPKIRIERQTETIDAEEILEREVKPFGKNSTSGHIILPKKFIGQKAFIIIEEMTGNFISGFKKKFNELSKKKKVK